MQLTGTSGSQIPAAVNYHLLRSSWRQRGIAIAAIDGWLTLQPSHPLCIQKLLGACSRMQSSNIRMQLSWVGRMRGGDAPESFENASAEISDRSRGKMHPPPLQRNLDKYILESGQIHFTLCDAVGSLEISDRSGCKSISSKASPPPQPPCISWCFKIKASFQRNKLNPHIVQ